jgi:hypothetical protein
MAFNTRVPGEADRDQGQEPRAVGGGQAAGGGQEVAEKGEQRELREQPHERVRMAAVVQQVSEGRRRDADIQEVGVREVRGHDTGGQEQAPRRGGAPSRSASSARAAPMKEWVRLSTCG